ncbi:MAG: RraA family protein [Pseudomonadota bacterium]
MIEEPPLLTISDQRLRPTESQIAAFQNAPTGFVCDALGGGGALDPRIRPLGEGRDVRCIAAGPALTAENGPADILATLAAVDLAQPGDILVLGFSGHTGCAALGDRVCGVAKNRGVAGVVTDGPMRDYAGLVEIGLPAWCDGLNPASPFAKGPGRVGFPSAIGGMTVSTGDMIVADRDGVVVAPFARIDEVIEKLGRVRALEAELDAEVRAGKREFGVLGEMLADGRAVKA